MAWIDWFIAAGMLLGLNFVALGCRKYLKSVADFLVAGRNVGKFLGNVSGDIAAGVGIMSLLATMQAAYTGGLAYWYLAIGGGATSLMIALSGWGVYRLRESKVLTINELLQKRYKSRRLRIFCGIVCFVSGIINSGIFPIVGGRFFVYFCGLPLELHLLGTTIPTIPALTGMLILVSLVFCFIGGQVSVIVTDFIQGIIVMLMFIIVTVATYRVVQWEHIAKAYSSQPNAMDLISPFGSANKNPFNIWFVILGTLLYLYRIVCWAPGQQARQSATDAEEARKMYLFNYLRLGMGWGLLFFVPAACFAVMHLSSFSGLSGSIQADVNTITNEAVRSQYIVPIFISKVLPIGIMGFLVAAMLSAFISTNDSLFLSWAGILVQDIILPLKKKPLTPKQHMWALRLSTIVVAILIYLVSILYKQTDYLYMFMESSGAIYYAGAGAIIMGALYWRRGTTAGAWAAMIIGTILAISGLIAKMFYPHLKILGLELNGYHYALFACASALTSYIIVSLCTPDPKFDLEALLHRKPENLEALRKNKIKSRTLIILWTICCVWTGGAIIAAWYLITHKVAITSWLTYYKWFIFTFFSWGVFATILFIFGGTRDLIKLLKSLSQEVIDITDDGQVHEENEK